MKYKTCSFNFSTKAEENIFSGYAAVFGNKDSHGDIIERGAFRKTLEEHSDRVKVLWQHDPWSPIGKPIRMHEDEKGLYIEAKVSQTDKGKEALRLMEDGVVNELSIGYEVIKEDHDEEREANILKEVKLWEFSPVTFAANSLATVTGVKDLNELRPFFQQVHQLRKELKEGRVLSQANYNKLQEAVKMINEVLEAAEPEKSTQQGEPGDHSSETLEDLLDYVEKTRKNQKAKQVKLELKEFGEKLRQRSVI